MEFCKLPGVRHAYLWKSRLASWKRRLRLERDSRDAIPIDASCGLFLVRFSGDDVGRFAEVFRTCWERIPAYVRYRLGEHWTQLRKEWAIRRSTIKIRLPIVAAYIDPIYVASDIGFLMGHLSVRREGVLDRLQMFGSIHLVFFRLPGDFDAMQDDDLLWRTAETIATYYLRVSNEDDGVEFCSGPSAEGIELARSWGFREMDSR